jgi:hypothetical protein
VLRRAERRFVPDRLKKPMTRAVIIKE